MIRIFSHEPGTPVVVPMELAGQKFDMELIPDDGKELEDLLKTFRKRKNVHNPITKQMEIHTYYEEDDEKVKAAFEDRLDRLVKNFWGIGDRDGNPIDGTIRANKIRLANVRVEVSENVEIVDPISKDTGIVLVKTTKRFREIIFEKIIELASTTAEADLKNSDGSPESTVTAGA